MIPGGASTVVKNIIDYGQDKFDFTLFSGVEGLTKQEQRILSDSYNVVFIPKLIRRISPINDFFAYSKLKHFFKKNNFNIVHTHTSKAGFIGRIAAKHANISKIIHSTHGSIYMPNSRIPGIPELDIYKKILLNAEKYLSPFTNLQIVLSRSEYDFSVQNGLSREKNTMIIPNGIFLENYSFSYDDKKKFKNELFPYAKDSIILLNIGRLSTEKGQFTLLKAFMKLLSEFKQKDIKLIFVGDGPERKRLESQSNSMIEKKIVFFTGYVADPRKYYAAADIFILPSFYEGFGLSLIEAMASGLPCVASDTGAIPEIITDRENGLLFPKGDSDSLKEKIKILLENPAFSAKIAKKARESAKKYDIKAILSQYYKIYGDSF